LQADWPPEGLSQRNKLRGQVDADNLGTLSAQGVDVTTRATPDVQYRTSGTTDDPKIHLVCFGQPSVNVEEVEATIAKPQLGSDGDQRTNHARLLETSSR
jgi:hypothetical protein